MLELIQQRFQTVVLVLLVFMLAAVFVLQFGGPQAQGCTTSINQTGFAARIYDETITEGDFRAAFSVASFDRYPTDNARALRLRELTLDGLIERELLAHAADELGFVASSDDVMREFAETSNIRLTPPVDAPAGYPGPEIPVDFTDERTGELNTKNVRLFINNRLRRSTEEFERWQVRERLAEMMRDAIRADLSVSPEEVRSAYVRETDRARISYVQFRQSFYESDLNPSDADITTWMAEHQEEVDAEYERVRSFRFSDLEEQVQARHILIRAAEDAPEEERAAARTRIDAIRVRLLGGEDFATVARAESDDTASAREGGELGGWTRRGTWVAPFEEAAFTQEVDAIGEVIESTFGYHVIQVIAHRQAGDVPEDEAKRELAGELYLEGRAGTLAREEADRALAYLHEGHTMAELDERLLHRWAELPPPPPLVEGEVPAPDAEAPAPDAAAEEEERPASSPQVRESRSFARTESPVVGSGRTGALTIAAYERTLDEPLPAEPIQVGDDWYVFQLVERTEATEEGFTDEVRERLTRSLLSIKEAEALRVFVHAARARAEESGELRTDPAILLYGDETVDEESEDEDEDEEEDDEAEDGEDEPAEPAERESAIEPRRAAIPT